MTMARVTVSLGSNIDSERNIRRAIELLQQRYGELTISPAYQTAAVGFEGDDFLNLVVLFSSSDKVNDIVRVLKQIEDSMGRDRSLPKFSARSIDLDLLTYDSQIIDEYGVQIPRHEILKNAFVLKPLSDIMGSERHPVVGKTYNELWNEMKSSADRIENIAFDLK
jgi:2-amino-4-hydroxy-6-hydroxymethyldihydropteridine diphosphokinase